MGMGVSMGMETTVAGPHEEGKILLEYCRNVSLLDFCGASHATKKPL